MMKLGRRIAAGVLAGVMAVSLGLVPAETLRAEEIPSDGIEGVIMADSGASGLGEEAISDLEYETLKKAGLEAGGTGQEDQEENTAEEGAMEDLKETMLEGQNGGLAESAEEEEGLETGDENNAQPDGVTESQEVMRASETVEQVTNIISGIDWTLDADGKLTIQSNEGMENWLKFGAVNLDKLVVSVEIQAGVTSIPGSFFAEYVNLTNITIPSSVTNIGNQAFWGCRSLMSITIPSSVTSIGKLTFASCIRLTNITIPSSVTSIEEEAFYGCSSLTSITIPSSVTSIGSKAFNGCSSLESVTMQGTTPPTLSVADENTGETYVFRFCKFVTDKGKGIKVPSGTAEAYKAAWAEWSDYIVTDDVGWMLDADGKLTIQSNEGMENWLKFGAVNLDKLVVSVEIQAGVTSIPGSFFAEYVNLTNITIPSSVTNIGNQAFWGCRSLMSITIPSSVTSIGKLTFASCIRLTNITIPSSVTSIEEEAFYGCSSLTSITIPSSVTSIGSKAFNGCSSLESVTMQGTTPPTLSVADENTGETYVFRFCKFVTDKGKGIKVPSGTAEAYKAVWTEWSDYIAEGSELTDREKVEIAKAAIEAALAAIQVSNDTTKESFEADIQNAVKDALTDAGIAGADVTIAMEAFTKTDAGTGTEGSIGASIKITSGMELAIVMVDKTIDKLPSTSADEDAEMAQKMVEDALKGITVTNETTREDIFAKLKEELGDKAKIEDIEDFEKEDATEEAPGNIRLRIRIEINGKTVIVNVTGHIAQLGRKTGVYVRFTDYYDLDGSTPRYKYTGLAVKPAVEVYNNETLLTSGTDYTISYKNNTKVGTAALTVKGKGNFSGTSNMVNFVIINADINRDTDHPTEMTVVVNTKVAPVIMNGTKQLTTKDYKLEGDGLVNGKYAVTTA